MTILTFDILFVVFIIFVVIIGAIGESNSFGYFFGRGKIKEKEKFIEVSFDSFLILREAIRISENKKLILKRNELPVLEIYEERPISYYDYYCSYGLRKAEENTILFSTFKDYFKYFRWLKRYLKEENKKEKQETIKNNFAEDTVKDLIKDLENFAEQEKKASAESFAQAKNTFNEVNKE